MSNGESTRRGFAFAAETSRRRRRRRALLVPPRGSRAQQEGRRLHDHVFFPGAPPAQWRGGLGAATPGPHGFLEGRVHGADHVGFHASSSSSEQEASDEEAAVRLFLDDLERSIVAPPCRNPEASRFFRDPTRRLDDRLAAAKNLVQLRWHPAVTSLWTHDRVAHLLDTVLCSLETELCDVRIWKPDALASYSACCNPASIWELARSSCCGDSGSHSALSWPSSSSDSSGARGASLDGYSMSVSLGEERSVRCGRALSGIDLKSVSILNEIAGVMIEAGYDEHMLRRAFDRHCERLARYIEILDIDRILGNRTDESRELLLKVWTSTMRIVPSVLGEMQRQLNNQNDFGLFNLLKEDYFSAVAKKSVLKLLKYATVICIQVDPSKNDPSCRDSHAAIKHDGSKMVDAVTMYQVLEHAKLEILTLLSGQTKDLILAEVERLRNGLSDTFVELLVKANDLLRSQRLVISDTGVHQVTRHVMDLLRLLVQQKDTVLTMLNSNQDNFGQTVSQLVSSLEFLLENNSKSLALKGQQQVFLLNNVNFMLEQADRCTDVTLILGERWRLQRHGQLDQFMASYLEASWTPVMSSLKITRIPAILWPRQLFDKFCSHFEKTYSVQRTWKVTDPQVRQKLREAIAQKVIPLYRMYMESYSEGEQQNSARYNKYNVEHLEAQLLEMFEG